MMNMDKILSIIVPSYNMEAYLPKCLGSLIIDNKELLQKLDVIVVNDGSKDRTSMIAHEFEAKYPGVFRVIDKANGHYGSCVNVGLAEARGVFAKILDADDYFDKVEFERFIREIASQGKKTEEYDLIVSQFDTVNPNGDVTAKHRWPLMTPCALRFEELRPHFGRIYLYHIAYRLENLRKLGYQQTEGIHYTDMEWITIPMSMVKRVYYTPFVVYKYLVGREGQSVNPKMRVVNADAYAKILVNCTRIYNERNAIWTEIAKEYIHGQLMQMASLAYGVLAYSLPIKVAGEKLAKLRNELRQISPSIMSELDSCLIMFGKSFRISVIGMCDNLGYAVGLRIVRWHKVMVLLLQRSLGR